MIGHGVSSRSSHSAAAGRTTCSAKPCTQSRMSRWSCESSSENGAAVAASMPPMLTSAAAPARRYRSAFWNSYAFAASDSYWYSSVPSPNGWSGLTS